MKFGVFFSYIFKPDTQYEGGALAQVTLEEIDNYSALNICGLEVKPFLLFHGRTEVLGFRMGSVAYATDCNQIPDRSLEVLKGVQHLVLDGLRYENHRTHYTIPQAVEIATKIGAKKTYLTHMTHSVEYEEVMSKLPSHVELAYDGLAIPVQ